MATRILNLVLIFLVSAVLGTVGTVAHQSSVTVLGVALPWGIAVALLGIACLLIGIRLVFIERAAVLAAALGVLTPIVIFSFKSVGGSVLIPDNTLGKVWIFAPVAIAAIIVAWPRVRRHNAAA